MKPAVAWNLGNPNDGSFFSKQPWNLCLLCGIGWSHFTSFYQRTDLSKHFLHASHDSVHWLRLVTGWEDD